MKSGLGVIYVAVQGLPFVAGKQKTAWIKVKLRDIRIPPRCE